MNEERKAPRRCACCCARNGQQVWRLKANPRIWWPGPCERDRKKDDETGAHRRDAESQAFVKASKLYADELDRVEVEASSGRCRQCIETGTVWLCPRCRHHLGPPPGDPQPCPLCDGKGTVVAASVEALTVLILRAWQASKAPAPPVTVRKPAPTQPRSELSRGKRRRRAHVR